jgi:predicted lipoprotein
MAERPQASKARGMTLTAACTTLLALAACRVVYDEPKDKAAPGSAELHAQDFDPSAWAASVFAPKVLPYFAAQALELAPVLDALKGDLDEAGKRFGRRADTEGSPWSFAVKGRGKVVSADTEASAGVLIVAVDAAGGPREVTLQLGPVVRGTAVRDCLPFFKFGDVTNQIQFAQVARALNERAVAGVQKAVPAVRAPGTLVEFTGAMNLSSADDPLAITPLILRPAGGP